MRSVTLPSSVAKLGQYAFEKCSNLVDVQLNEGLQVIKGCAFEECTALQSVTLPSTVTEVDVGAFFRCINLVELQLNEGLQSIGGSAFERCTALQSVTIPSTVTEMSHCAFGGCSNLSEVIFLVGERLLHQDFLARGIFSEEQGLLNQGALDEMLFDEINEYRHFAFRGCLLAAVKISISWALSERIVRLSQECSVSVEERIRNLPRFELSQDGNVLACFPVVRRASDDEAEDCSDTDDVEVAFTAQDTNHGAEDDSDDEAEDESTYEIQDINLETARSLHQVLQLIAFHELKESSRPLYLN